MKPRHVIIGSGEESTIKRADTRVSAHPAARKLRLAPDYVSADTLAQRLDCSKTTVHGYVRRGILPRPIKIGELVRWRWATVEKCIESLETGGDSNADANDPYIAGIERGTTKEASH